MKTNFFITYHHGDELAARWIAGVLKDVPFSLFMESWDFLPGRLPVEKIDHMTAIAPCALVLVSDRFLQAGVDAESWQAVTERFDTNAVVLLRIDSCNIETTLGAVTYTDLFDIKCPKAKKESEVRKRLLATVSPPAPDKKETEGLPVTAMTREEVLEKRKAELEELLTATIKHNYHMKLDLEQEVEKEVEIKDGRHGKKVKRKQSVWKQVALETILKDGNNYILVNPSGMGKTTFLTHVGHVLLGGAGAFPYIPLSFLCIDLNKREGSIPSFIQKEVESLYNNAQTALVQGDWENLCVLLDALDQARDVGDIVSSLQLLSKSHYYKKAKIILSSRENTASKVKTGFRKIRLKLPGADEVRHYLGEENYKQLEGHIAASEELVKVPVLLEMLKTITEKGYGTSKLWNRTGLYTEFTKILVDQERNKPRFWQDSSARHHFIDNELEQALEKIAFFSLVENNILEIEKEKLVHYCETPEKKEALLNIGIVLELFEDREQKIVFRHQSFQAYFAARYMYFRRPELFEQLTDDIRFFYNDVWYEVMRFYVGLEKDPQKAWDIIGSLLKKDTGTNALDKTIRGEDAYDFTNVLRLIFTVFLMSEIRASIEKVQTLYEQLRALLTNNSQYWNLFLLNINKFHSNNVRMRTIFGSKFEAILKEQDWEVRNDADQILTKIYRITPPQSLRGDEGWGDCSDSTEMLGETYFVNKINILRQMFEHGDSDDCSFAAEKLGDIGSDNDIPFLIPLLKNTESVVRIATAEAIEKIYKRFIPELRIDEVLPKSKKKVALIVNTAPTHPLHILHISDIHYSAENDPSITRIFHEFLKDINKWRNERPGENIHAICLTGDIAQSGQKDQYESINEKINKILETTGCSKDNLFIIPGNHDVHDYKNISPEGKKNLKKVEKNKLTIDSHVLPNFETYREFHEKFNHYYTFLETSGYLNSLTETHNGNPKPWYSRKLKDFPVRIIGLNSALFCLENHCQRNKIRMGSRQFDEAYFQGKLKDTDNNEAVILLTHHPTDWLEETEYNDYTTLMEQYAFIHLHGHIHRLKIRKLSSYSGSSYLSIGTGSLYGEKGTKDINTYHIMTLDFKNEEIHIWGRRWVPEHSMWTTFMDNSRDTFSFPGKHVSKI